MNDQNRKQLRRANTLVAGLMLRAEQSSSREESQQVLAEALLTYALLSPFES